MLARGIRPRFRLPVGLGAAELIERLEDRLNHPDCPCRGMIARNHDTAELRVPERDRHFWSPALSITFAEQEDGSGSVVHGVVGPNPNVWTLFAMVYMGLWTALLFVGVFGLVQWGLDQRPWGLYFTPLLIAGLLLMYVLSRIGQRLAMPQTLLLKRFLEEALGEEGSEHR